MLACVSEGASEGSDDSPDVLPAAEFEAQVVGALSEEPRAAAIVDLDADGALDIVVVHQFGAQEAIDVSLGVGDGSFAPPLATGLTGRGVDVVALHADGDAHVDLAWAGDGAAELRWAAGDGAGGFGALVSIPVPALPSALVSADFNADGDPDLAVANFGSLGTPGDTVSVLAGHRDGTFEPVELIVGEGPSELASADFNGDGTADLAVGFIQTAEVAVFLGGAQGLSESGRYPLSTPVFALEAAALLGGPGPDLVITDIVGDSVVVLPSTDDGFGPARVLATGALPFGVAVLDANRDGVPDVVTTLAGAGEVGWLAGPEFEFDSLNSLGAERLGDLTPADLDGDGATDLVVLERGASNSAGTLHVLLNREP